jgi:acyl carrier protein
MATAAHLEQYERIGNHGLAPEDALQALDSAVSSGKAQVVVADIDWDRFRPVYEARRPNPLVEETLCHVPSAIERDMTPGVFVSPWVASLVALPVADRERALAQLLRREVAETLGFDDTDAVPLDRSLYDIGVDSLLMAELVGRLKAQAGFSCGALLFEQPEVQALAASLVKRMFPDDVRLGGADRARPAEGTAGYTPDAEPEIFAFSAEAWPERSPALVLARWRWMYVDSARRLGVGPRVWLHRDSGRIVGHMGSIPVRLKVGDEERPTGWLVDTMVLSDYRGQALGSRLMVEAHNDQPFSLSLGQTEEMREIQFRLGWVQVAPLQTAQLLVRPVEVLRGKLPAPAAWAAGLGLRATNALRGLMGEKPGLQAREVARFDERHDRLWTCASRDLICSVVRDASYLNWKYVDRPGQDFMRLELTGPDGVAQGVAVWMLRDPDHRYRYRRAHLVDLVAPLADAARLQQVLRTACAAAAALGADALVCLHIDARLTHALRAAGFHLRAPERFLLVDPGPLTGEARERVLSPDGWFVTQGDSDIDRPQGEGVSNSKSQIPNSKSQTETP